MKKTNSTLVAALACVIMTIVTFTMKWVSLYFMKASIWQVSELISNIGQFTGESGYRVFAGAISGGACLAIVLLAGDVFRIIAPLFDGKNGISSALKAGIGGSCTILYSILFCAVVLLSNNGELDGASITLWPIASVVLCIAEKAFLGKLKDGAEVVPKESTASDPSESEAAKPDLHKAVPDAKKLAIAAKGNAKAAWRCDKCFAVNPGKANFCSHCGKRHVQTWKCGSCGTNNSEAYIFCPRCGHDKETIKPSSATRYTGWAIQSGNLTLK